jgi:hypothetical protein
MTLDAAFPVYYGQQRLDGDGAEDVGRDDEEKRSRRESSGRVSFRTVNKGTYLKDLPRGKATGRRWGFSGVVDLVVEEGKIVRCDEWYDWSGRTEEGVAGAEIGGDKEEKAWEAWTVGDGYHVLREGDVDQRTADKPRV